MAQIALSLPNAQYNLAKPDSLPVRIAAYQRRRMFDAFLDATGVAQADTILDVGVTSDRTYGHSNYLEAWYPYKNRITAAGIDDAGFLERLYPGLRFIQADGRDLLLPTARSTTCIRAPSSSMSEAGRSSRGSSKSCGGWRARPSS
jgi:hypothetical protein